MMGGTYMRLASSSLVAFLAAVSLAQAADGDTKRGASLIVWAIAEGRKMAAGINQYLSAGKSAKSAR